MLKTEKSRIDAVDALRGFAVMAILLVHSLEHFIFPVYPASSPAWLAALDEGVFAVVFALFAGKAYATFALLFGFTFHLQYASVTIEVTYLYRMKPGFQSLLHNNLYRRMCSIIISQQFTVKH